MLTDFEQFHVLDCRYKPDLETALNRAVAKYHYSDYANEQKFAEIYWLFSREAVAAGSLEKRAAELPKPRGKAVQRGLLPVGWKSIDTAFLEDLDQYRMELAKAFKKHNPQLASDQLTEATQRALDRLVFIRFLEDKGIEEQRLVDKFGDKGTAWEDFIAASRRLDGIYNGIVFKEHPLLDKPGFRVDDDIFADICEKLAHVNSPYDFNAIPIHILGFIYERFLGKIIVATDKRVRVEEKPEVRKAGGVYYTPDTSFATSSRTPLANSSPAKHPTKSPGCDLPTSLAAAAVSCSASMTPCWTTTANGSTNIPIKSAKATASSATAS